MIKKISIIICCLAAGVDGYCQPSDSLVMRRIANEILLHGRCYYWLDYLSNTIGGRLAGSPQAAAAVEYTYQLMERMHPDTVYKQECMVPHWVRGDKEFAKILTTKTGEYATDICALGGSVPTPPEGLTANVVEVHSFDDVVKLGKAGIEGKIVFYNRPFDETKINTFEAYGGAVTQRWAGADWASKYGAIGMVVRSMTNSIDDYPHTGVMNYNDSVPKIPSCAISTKGAEMLSALLKTDAKLNFHFKQSCRMLPDEKSYNVIGEIRGTEHPEEIIVVGGHLDSWELGKGAQDDGAGDVQSLEILRTFLTIGIRPKRTIRVVMFINEENGGRGAKKYAELAKQRHEKHIVAIESDAGGYSPRGFGFDGPPEKKARILAWKDLFLQYGVYDFSSTESGSDVEPLKDQNVPLMGLIPDSQRYFDIHHTAQDTFDKVNKRELELGAASMAMLIYLIDKYGL